MLNKYLVITGAGRITYVKLKLIGLFLFLSNLDYSITPIGWLKCFQKYVPYLNISNAAISQYIYQNISKAQLLLIKHWGMQELIKVIFIGVIFISIIQIN